MTSELSKYACDECKSRKVRCSKEQPNCRQCTESSRQCKYSRSGIIRRKRKRKHTLTPCAVQDSPSGDDNASNSANLDASTRSVNHGSTGRSQNAFEPHSTREGEGVAGQSEPSVSSTNPILPWGMEQFWQDSAFIEMAERMRIHENVLFTFEEEAASWTKLFAELMEIGKPLFRPVPVDVLNKLATHPEQISRKAYLILFYGVLLTEVSSDTSYSDETKTKLRWNLWICLNDARLLLEPSDINLQALILLACHVQDFHTPSLCWMLTTTACRMLQALGINARSLDEPTRKRRIELFWFLNGVDKLLALIFGRPPTFPSASSRSIPIPAIQELTDFHPHTPSSPSNGGTTSFFGAHFLHRIYILPEIMGEMWTCLYDEGAEIGSSAQVRRKLDDWYAETKRILEASAVAEEPFIDTWAQQQLRLGIRHIEFQYLYLTVLLTKSNSRQSDYRQARVQDHDKDDECIRASRRSLHILDSLVSDSRDVYNGIVWQLLFAPFTPFFALLDQIRALAHSSVGIRSTRNTEGANKTEVEAATVAEMKESVESMEDLPKFLDRMVTRHPLAEKLCSVASEHLNIAHRLVETSCQTGLNGRTRAVTRNSVAVPSQIPRVLRPSTVSVADGGLSTSNSTPALHSTSITSPATLATPIAHTAQSQLLEFSQKPSGFLSASDSSGSLGYGLDFGGFDWFEWDSNINWNAGNASG